MACRTCCSYRIRCNIAISIMLNNVQINVSCSDRIHSCNEIIFDGPADKAIKKIIVSGHFKILN